MDTGVWIGLCDLRDRTVTEDEFNDIYERIRVHSVVVPWPVAYETLRTRLVRNRLALQQFEKEMKSLNVVLLDDAKYRDDAFNLSIESSLRGHRPLSMVDCMMRLLLDDHDTNIKYLVTFNPGDFSDICAKRRIELWSQ